MTIRDTSMRAFHCDNPLRLGVYAPKDGHPSITLDLFDAKDPTCRSYAGPSIHIPRDLEARLKRAVEAFNSILLAPDEPDAAAEYSFEELPRW